MAENAVVKEQLTDAMIDAGEALVMKLDELGVSVTAALWLFARDSNEWQLFFASPEAVTKGPRQVYQKIQSAIEQIGPRAVAVPLAVIGLLDPSGETLQLLRSAIRTGPGVNRIRFSKNAINGHFIDDALIYRLA